LLFKNLLFMRWKLLITTSAAAAFIGFALWCVVAIGLFGSVTRLARNDAVLLASVLIPLVFAGLAAFFAYRHTARRRKMQALITTLLTILFAVLAYFAATTLARDRFVIPRTYELRHAR
jgi:hypothetical protein